MKNIYIITLICLFSTKISAQLDLTRPASILSPQAAGLGEYGSFPVNLYTGSANISIPINEFGSGNIKVDISLNYDNSGVRVVNHPTWVGQNWNLSAGGVIVRTVKGDYDERPIGEYLSYNSMGQQLSDKFGGFFSTLNDLDYYKGMNYNEICRYDCEADVFTFNFMGKTGKFFKANDGNWAIQSNFNIEIMDKDVDLSTPYFGDPTIYNYISENIENTIAGFHLRDDQGNVYEFGYENAVEYSIDFFNQVTKPNSSFNPTKWHADAWFLKSIKDCNGRELYSFEYNRGKFIADFYESYKTLKCTPQNGWGFTSFSTPIYKSINDFDNLDNLIDFANNSFGNNDKRQGLFGNLTSPIYLKSIRDCETQMMAIFIGSPSNERPYMDYSFPNYANLQTNYGTTFPIRTWVDQKYEAVTQKSVRYPYLETGNPNFVSSDSSSYLGHPVKALSWYKLDEICFERNYGQARGSLEKRISLEYNNGNSDKKRQFLTAIKAHHDNTQTTDFKYSFEYYKDYINQDFDLPDYLSYKTDHWGYFNNINSTFSTSENRTPNNNTISGSLRKIIYPTGGSTTLEYELNSYNIYFDSNRIQRNALQTQNGGGLRIKSIINDDGRSINKRIYSYPTGIINKLPQYEYTINTTTNTSFGSIAIKQRNSTPIFPLSNFSGTIIEYPKVLENIYKVDRLTSVPELVLKNIYTFTSSIDSNYSDPKPLVFGIDRCSLFSDMSFYRGRLKSKETYNANNIIAESTEYSYKPIASPYTYDAYIFDILTLISNPSIIGGASYPQVTLWLNNSSVSVYQQFCGNMLLNKEVHKTYLENSQTITNLRIYYRSQDTIEMPASENTSLAKKRKLTYSLLNKEIEYNNNVYSSEKSYTYSINDTSNVEYRWLTNKFKIQPLKTIINKGQASDTIEIKYKFYNNRVVPDSYHLTSSKPNGYKDFTYYNNYDSRDNLSSYTEKDGTTTSIIYGRFNKPLAIIKNASYQAVKSILSYDYSGSSSILDNDLVKIRNINNDVKLYHYEYDEFGYLKKLIRPNDQGEIYNYDNAHRLSSISTLDGIELKSLFYNYREGEYPSDVNDPYFP